MTSAGSYERFHCRQPLALSEVEWRIDVQLAEARELLRLPIPEVGLESGQTFAAAAALLLVPREPSQRHSYGVPS